MPCQLDVDGVLWQACLTELLRHLMTQRRTSCPTSRVDNHSHKVLQPL